MRYRPTTVHHARDEERVRFQVIASPFYGTEFARGNVPLLEACLIYDSRIDLNTR